MKKISYFIFGLSFLTFFISLAIYFYLATPLKTGEFNITVEITEDVLGVDVNPEVISFGKVPFGSKGTRAIKIENNYPFPIVVESEVYGAVKEFVTIDKKFIEPFHNDTIGISFISGEGISLGEYEGVLVYKLKRFVR